MPDSRVLDYLRTHPRALRTYRGVVWSLAFVRGDLGVQPEAATSAEVLGDRKKLNAVAKRVYDELVGLEESWRKVEPERKIGSVKQRLPGGYSDAEAEVLKTCRLHPEERPFRSTWTRIARELGSL